MNLKLPRAASSVAAVNLMEQNEGALTMTGDVVAVPTKPYEIRTVKVIFK